jgi:hypothetical protein
MRIVLAVFATAILATACANAPAPAQQTASTAATVVAPSAPANPASTQITPELMKKAAQVGYFPRTRGGVPMFCRTDSDIGTRFTTEKCVNEDQLAEIVQRMREVRDNMHKGGACGTPTCSSN